MNTALSRFHLAQKTLEQEYAILENATQKLSNVEEAQDIIQKVAQTVQQKAHTQICSVVSKCLSTVFEDPYEFSIVFERKRGKTDAVLTFKRGSYEVDPRGGSGGGVLDVAVLALRVAVVVMARPKLRPLIVMDEPFKWLSPDARRTRVAGLLVTLAKEMGIQFVIVTNIDGFRPGKIIDLSQT